MHHGKVSKKIAAGLKVLKERIDKAEIPSSKLDESLNLATWNIRDFGKKERKEISLHYIAEILGQFDLIAVIEVRDNLADLKAVLEMLGPYWRAVFSDFIPDPGGNRERVAYVYDKRMVEFTGLAVEADAPRKKDPKTKEYVPKFSWWRSPYIASFTAGSFDFVLISVHIRWGSGKKARVEPLKLLGEWVEARRNQKHGVDKDLILLGDFNIPKVDDELFQAITDNGLKIPEVFRGTNHGSNLAKNKRYDQILFYEENTKSFTDKGGVLDFYTGGFKKLYPRMNLSKRAFTYELSDHLPLWVQLDTDIEGEKLDQLLNPPRRRPSGRKRR